MNADTAQAVRGGVGYGRNLTKKIFVNVFNDYEYDKFQSLDLRVTVGGGVGYYLWKRDRGALSLVGGGDWNHEKFDPAPLPKFTRSTAEFYWGDDYTYKLSARSSFTQAFRMFNNLSDTGNYRVNFDLGANTQLFKWLSWNLSFSDRYLTNPAPDHKTNDMLIHHRFGYQLRPQVACRGDHRFLWSACVVRHNVTRGRRRKTIVCPTYLMSNIQVTLPDGSVKSVEAGATPLDVARSISPRLADDAIVARVDGDLVGSDPGLEADAKLEILTTRNPEALEVYRHSTAHLLAAAVLELFPETKLGIGPPIETGFYYDFQRDRRSLPKIWKRSRSACGRFRRATCPTSASTCPSRRA